MFRIADLQDKDQNVAIDVDYFLNGKTVVVTDFDIFLPDENDCWKEIQDQKKARELFNKYDCKELIWEYLAKWAEFNFDEIKV